MAEAAKQARTRPAPPLPALGEEEPEDGGANGRQAPRAAETAAPRRDRRLLIAALLLPLLILGAVFGVRWYLGLPLLPDHSLHDPLRAGRRLDLHPAHPRSHGDRPDGGPRDGDGAADHLLPRPRRPR